MVHPEDKIDKKKNSYVSRLLKILCRLNLLTYLSATVELRIILYIDNNNKLLKPHTYPDGFLRLLFQASRTGVLLNIPRIST